MLKNRRFGRFVRISMALVAGAGVAAGLLVRGGAVRELAAQDAAAQSRPAAEPRYNERGELLLPVGYEDWIFVGSNLGLEYKEGGDAADAGTSKREELRNFHNVYINPTAYEHFRKTGEFPEKTVLVLDIYAAERGDGKTLVSQGLFPGKHQEVAVAVKDSARKDGSKTNWAYYDFPAGAATARAFPDKQCYQCHLEHGSVDNVFVQFYPTLKKVHDRRQGK